MIISKVNIAINLALFCLINPQVDLKSQSLQDTYAYALERYQEGYHAESIPDFTRAMFFADKSSSIYSYANYYLGMAHYKSNQFEESLKYLKTARHLDLNDSLKTEIALFIAAAHLQRQEPKFALANLLAMDTGTTPSEYFERKVTFYISLAYFLNHDFEKSKSKLYQVDTAYYRVHRETIDKIYNRSERYAGMNPRLISYLSIVPGLGQLYMGEYGEAANSLLLNGSIYLLYVITIQHLSLVDALISVFPWFHRYYVGGIMKTQKLAEQAIHKGIIEGFNTLVKIYSE